MVSSTVTKRKNKTSSSRQYDVKYSSFKSSKKRKSVFKMKAEAVNAAQQLIRDLEDGSAIDDKTFKEYYEDWLEVNGKLKLSEKQVYWYERALTLLLEHFSEDVKIKQITESQLKLVNELVNEEMQRRTKASV